MLRLLILLLIACLAAPAVATEACEPPPAEVGAQSAHGHHAPPETPAPAPEESASHGCIGCIPPASAIAPGAGDPLPPSPQRHGFPPAADRGRTGFAPIPPPPRHFA